MSDDLVFVGGTGRSGTHIVAKLLGRHSRYRNIKTELRFHVDPGGFPDLLAGKVTLEEFVSKLWGFWWYRERRQGIRGVHKVVPRERFAEAVARFESAYPEDPVAACHRLFLEVTRPLAEEGGKPGLVEMSTRTVVEGPTLLRIFPGAKLIHSVRDGRDVAASVTARQWGPDGVIDGLRWWADRLRRIDAAVRETPPDGLLVVGLDELLWGRRKESYRELREFLDLTPERRMRRYFRRHMKPWDANIGRWREGLSERKQASVLRRYERILDDLEAAGVHCAPLLRRVYERAQERPEPRAAS
jgi:hypothetical protein